MSFLRGQISHIWNLRRDARRGVRFLWWVSLLALVGLMIAPRQMGSLLAGIWITVSILRGLLASAWSLLNLRDIYGARRIALRWSLWLAMISCLLFYASMQEQRALAHPLPPTVLVLLTCAAFPVFFVLALLFSLFGAALGAYAFRNNTDLKEAVPLSVTAWWFCVLGSLALVFLLRAVRLDALYITAFVFGTPHYTIWLTAWLRRRGYEPQELTPRLVNAILGRLNMRWTRQGRTRRLDLRGVTLGIFAAAFALMVGNQVLLVTQESALASLMRIRHQVYEAFMQQWQAPLPPDGPVILLKMDAASSAAILTSRSESALQADIIRKLQKLGVAHIVLPYPTLKRQEDIGATTEEAISHTRRDLSQLIAAMREAGNVTLVFNSESSSSQEGRQLTQAASEVASFGVEMYGPAQIPSIPLSWKDMPPASLLLLALYHHQKLDPDLQGEAPVAHSIAGILLPQCVPGRMFVDFRSNTTTRLPLFNETIETVAYTTLLTENSIEVQNMTGATHPVKMEDYFRGKIVFLEPLIQTPTETPIGSMPRFEALARITNTLLSGYALNRASAGWTLFMTLALGALVGHLCVRRDPLEASWRIILLLLLVFAYTLVAFFGGIWVDPVVPIVTVSLAFLLITRLTFTLERDARDRNRRLLQRFLAPQIAEQLLDAPEEALGLGGDKRRVAVLFADVRNFTGFAESHAPEEVIEVVNLYMTALTDALDIFGGILDKYTGDGLMAFFLIDRHPEAEIEQAVLAALAMRNAALTLSARQKAEGRPVLNIGYGMHYGEAVVGLVGNRNRQINYTALGHTVVVSARLQTLAEGGEIVISETMHDLVRGRFHVVDHSPVQVKGISAPMHPYFVLDPVEEA